MRSTAAPAIPKPPAGEHRYRMKELVDRTGLPRQVIHFYIQQGLVPEGHKTGRNMAYYGDEHLERIKLVRQLQHERFLPLKAIRAVLGTGTPLRVPAQPGAEPFSPEQRAILLEVKDRLTRTMGAPASGYVSAADVLARTGVSAADLDMMIELDLVAGVREGKGKKKKLAIAEDDVWIVENWGKLREIGFTREMGFTPSDMAVYEEALSSLFAAEKKMLTERMHKLPAERVATMVEQAIPLLNSFLVRYHERKIRAFFASLST